MAWFDLPTCVGATAGLAAAAASIARRSPVRPSRFLLAFVGVAIADILTMLPYLLFGWFQPIKGGVLSSAAIAWSHISMLALHLPSIVALGVDENLERHGTLVTTVGHLLDLALWTMAAYSLGAGRQLLRRAASKELRPTSRRSGPA
jgi:hypothetical protein